MRFLADVAAQAVGDERHTAVTAALAGGELVRERAYERMSAAYDTLELASPQRRAGEFVPSFIPTRTGQFDDYGQAPSFVARAVLYGHRVALANPLQLHRWPLGGFEGPGADFERDLRVALLLGPLERAGLVIYLDPNVPGGPVLTRTDDSIPVLPTPTDPTEAELDDFYKAHLAGAGSRASVLRDRQRRAFTELEISTNWWEVQNILAWQTHHHDVADLYVPEYLRATMEWVLRRRGAALLVGETKQSDHEVLAALCRLPTIEPDALGRLTVKDLLEMRQERIFEKWRDSLLAGAKAAEAAGTDTEAVIAFVRIVTSSRDRLLKEATTLQPFRALGTSAGAFSVSVASRLAGAAVGATGAAATGSFAGALVSAFVGAGVTVLPALTQSTATALTQGRRRQAIEQHLSLFAAGS